MARTAWVERIHRVEQVEEAQPPSRVVKPVTSFISLLRHWGGIGVLILAALDSSVLPTPGVVDALTILLAAGHSDLWPYYAMCSTEARFREHHWPSGYVSFFLANGTAYAAGGLCETAMEALR